MPGLGTPRLAGTRVEPRRSCIGCRQVKAKSELVRIAIVDGGLVRDPGRIAGRTAYLCRNPACWGLAEKRHALDRALGAHASADDWKRLREGILI